MSNTRKNLLRIDRKKGRVRYKVKRTGAGKLRISVFRSLKHVYAQIIDDVQQSTITSCSSLEITTKTPKNKKEVAFEVGKALAKKLLGINKEYKDKVVFDRGPYIYHGRVAEVASGLREGGLSF